MRPLIVEVPSPLGLRPSGVELAPAALRAALRPDEHFHEDPHMSWLTLTGRRNKGTAIAEVSAELAVIASQIDRRLSRCEHAGSAADFTVEKRHALV